MTTPELTAEVAESVSDSSAWSGLAALPGEQGNASSDAAIYTTAVYGGQVLVFVGGVIQKGLLGPRLIGYWTLASTLMVFLSVLPLGTFDGATRQVPAERGRGRFGRAAALADTSASFTVLAFAFGGLATAIAALILGGSWAPQLRYGLMLLGLLAPVRAFVDCHALVYQATRRFRALAAGVLLTAVIGLTLQTLLVYLVGYWGLFIGLAAGSVGSLLLWSKMGLAGLRRPAFRWRIELSSVRDLLPVGIPILVFSQIWLVFMAADSLLVARLLDATRLGYYALAISVTNYILLTPRSIAAALFPRMQERFAPKQDVGAIRHYAVDVQVLLALIVLPLLVASAFFLVPTLVRQVLPAFVPGIPALHILVAGSFLIALVNMPVELLITTGRRWSVTGLLMGCLAFNVAANYVAIGVLDGGIRGAAIATALSYFVLMITSGVYGLQTALSTASLSRHLAVILGAFAYAVSALWAVELLVRVGTNVGAVADVLAAFAKLAIFTVLMVPLLAVAQRRYNALQMLWPLLSSLIRRVRRMAH